MTSGLPSPGDLRGWLEASADVVTADGYRHQVLTEATRREDILAELTALVDRVHGDVVEHVRRVAGISLVPTRLEGVLPDGLPDPTDGYPELLPRSVLMGYFGEIVAGIIAETSEPHSLDGWVVPAYLFRFHTLAFELLERVRQGAAIPVAIPGRTGDDCLAFIRDEEGEITHALVCEAKCYARHDAGAIENAHVKASSPEGVPTSVLQVVEVLLDSPDPVAQEWAAALRRLRLRPGSGYKRLDFIAYVCGQRARDAHGYLPCTEAHPSYTGGRALEAIDVHLRNVWSLVAAVYGVDRT
jgi:hypothetical protein